MQVSQIHKQLPPGGILVFVTGQREVEHLCDRLRASFSRQATSGDRKGKTIPQSVGGEALQGENEEDELIEASGNDRAEQDADLLGKHLSFLQICTLTQQEDQILKQSIFSHIYEKKHALLCS